MARSPRIPKLKHLASDRALWAAWSRVAAGSNMPGVDGVTASSFAQRIDTELRSLQASMLDGSYRPNALREFERSTGAKRRLLSMPTVRDRIAQRAALDVLSPVLDKGQSSSSFAYRKGRSWLDALRRVERYRDLGLRWVFRADIESFFGTLDHELLANALRTAGLDTEVTDLLMGWVRAPRAAATGMEAPQHGIPLGVPLSGMLANHFLAPFDKAVKSHHPSFVRYADDIAIFESTDMDANRARFVAEQALDCLGLRFNPAKTYVSSFDTGFCLLGWVFFREGGHEEKGNSEWVHPMSVGRDRR